MNFNIQPKLENNSIILLPLSNTDWDELYQVAADPKIWEQHPQKDRWQKSVFRTFFEDALSSGGAFKIVAKQNNTTIGSSRFYNYNSSNNSIFLGYTFYNVASWGTGINHQVKKLMLDYIFQYVDLVFFHIGANNLRSQISISRLGAIKVGEQETFYVGESSRYNFTYCITKENWIV